MAIVALVFLVSAMLAPVGVLSAWTGLVFAAWVRDVSVLLASATGLFLWIAMRRDRAGGGRRSTGSETRR
jgi:hypothetical protein